MENLCIPGVNISGSFISFLCPKNYTFILPGFSRNLDLVTSIPRYFEFDDDNNNNNNLLQSGCHPVAVVILHVNKT